MTKPDAIPAIRARRRVFLTGTPIVNRPIEMWPLVRSLDPNGLGKSWRAYVTRYCNGHQTRYGWDVSGASNLDELQTKLRATFMVRRLKSEVLTELPPKVRQVIDVPADGMAHLLRAEAALFEGHKATLSKLQATVDELREQGGAAYTAAVEQLRTATGVAFEKMARARLDLAVAKLPFVIEHLDSVVEATGKVVVMCWHHEIVDALLAHFGRSAVSVTGKVAIADRQAAVERFQTDPSCTVFVGTIKAAGVGLTLTAASTVVFAEQWWVPGDITQAEDRCHRIGQTDSVLVQHLVVDGSLDATQARVTVQKQDVIDRALDVGAKAVEAPKPLAVAQPQQAPVEALFDRLAPIAAPQAPKAATASLSGLVAYMDKAAEKLSQPRVKLAYDGKSEIQISRAGRESRNAGCVYVKVDGEYAGKVTRSGVFFAVGSFSAEQSNIEAVLTAFLADPEGTAKAYGKLKGACCFCHQDLTDERSVRAGYGPICAENYNLPWG